MANILNVKELIGTSYFYLREYFDNKSITSDFDKYIPKDVTKVKKNTSHKINEYKGTEATKSDVLKGIVETTFFELPTMYSKELGSIGIYNSVSGLANNIVKKTDIQSKENNEDEDEDELDNDFDIEPFEKDISRKQPNTVTPGESVITQPEIQPEIQPVNNPVIDEKEKEKEKEEAIQIKEEAIQIKEEAIQIKQDIENEEKYKLEQIKQFLAISTGNKNVAERKLIEAEELLKNKRSFFGRNEKLEQNVEEKKKEKEKAEEEYKKWYDKHLEATKEDRERKQREKEDAEKEKRYEEIAALFEQTQQKEREKDAADKISAYIAKRKEALKTQKDQKEAAEKQKRLEAVEAQLKEIKQNEAAATTTAQKDAAEADKQSLLDKLEKEEGALDLGDIGLQENPDESKRQAITEAATKAVNAINFLGLSNFEAILQAQKQLAEKTRLTQEDEARKKAIESLFKSTSLVVGESRAQIEQNTKDFLTQTKSNLEEKKRQIQEINLSNIDSIDKITPLRQKNNEIKTTITQIYQEIDKKTDEYVKVLVDTQLTEQKEIKNKEIEALTAKIGELYDSITLDSDNVDLILNSTEYNLKQIAADKRKQEEEEAKQRTLTEQQRAAKMAKVVEEISKISGAIIGTKEFIEKTLDEINEIQLKPTFSGDIDTLSTKIEALEKALRELEGYNTTIQTVLVKNNLSQNGEIKTKYPEIDDMNDLIQKGKGIVTLTKGTITAQQEKQTKIIELKLKMDAFKKMIESVTKNIMNNMGKLNPNDKETNLDAAKTIIDEIIDQYKRVETENKHTQKRIESGTFDEEISTKNKEIQELIRGMKIRFRVAQGLYDELSKRPATIQIEQRREPEVVDIQTASQSSLKDSVSSRQRDGTIGLDISGFLKQLSEFLKKTNKLKTKIEEKMTLFENKAYSTKDKKEYLDNIKLELDSIKLNNGRLKGIIQSYISDESIKPEIKESIRTEITKIQNSIDEISLQVNNRVEPFKLRQIEVARKEGEGEEAPKENTRLGRATVTRLVNSVTRSKSQTGNETRRQQRQEEDDEEKLGPNHPIIPEAIPQAKSPGTPRAIPQGTPRAKPPGTSRGIGETITADAGKKRTNPKVIMKAWEGGKKTTKRRNTNKNKKTKKRYT